MDEKALRAAFAVNHHPESEPSETELAKLRAAITAYLQALSPGSTGDWVLVPKEPTWQMEDAFLKASPLRVEDSFEQCYRAMLSAAGER